MATIRLHRGSDEALYTLLQQLENAVPHPNTSDLIFYNTQNLSDAEIVDIALSYKPIALGWEDENKNPAE